MKIWDARNDPVLVFSACKIPFSLVGKAGPPPKNFMDTKSSAVKKYVAEVATKLPQVTPAVIVQSQNICADSPIPAGWIVVDDHWDPTMCGNPAEVECNVRTIHKINALPAGTTISACSYAPTPAGWVEIGTKWDPTACGLPQDPSVRNVKIIKRLL